MRYREFGGKKTSVVAFGCANFGGKQPEGLAREFLDAYVALGGNFIDTARVYGDFATPRDGESEKVIGRWLDGKRREDFFLSTKGAHPRLHSMNVPRLSRAEIMDDIQRSLEDLHTDHLDIYWLHRDDVNRPVADILETLNELVDNGMTRMTGVSNWSTARIREANACARAHGMHVIDANQPQFSLAKRVCASDPTLVSMDEEMYRMHLETGMILAPYSSQANGFFSKWAQLGEEGLPAGVRRDFMCQENREIYARCLELRAKTGLSVGALALAWLMDQPFPVFPLCGASHMEQIEALAEAADATITPEQRDFLRKIG